eukprot:TRINITY_DN22625_c0_g1_i1.p1 TRINITY_DN22625_c0_g1~~TRINITY_DN22625_c0_g1_i1.p1  ORF type:complete len:157 (-),score=6.40 TRINITY_DN22625_c0_g1_i1:7-477(-)
MSRLNFYAHLPLPHLPTLPSAAEGVGGSMMQTLTDAPDLHWKGCRWQLRAEAAVLGARSRHSKDNKSNAWFTRSWFLHTRFPPEPSSEGFRDAGVRVRKAWACQLRQASGWMSHTLSSESLDPVLSNLSFAWVWEKKRCRRRTAGTCCAPGLRASS